MKTEQRRWEKETGWRPPLAGGLGDSATLVLLFGGREVLKAGAGLSELRKAYPRALIAGCSTAGEICNTQVHDDTLVATAVAFDATEVRGVRTNIANQEGSFDAGRTLAQGLALDGLVHVVVFSDGTRVNGSELVRGMLNVLPKGVAVTGGLAGDGTRFEETLVILGDGAATPGMIAALGFYGVKLRVGYGSLGGWDPFGPERLVTRARGNVLHELDDKPALKLYKDYLGEHAAGLPSTGLLFPLIVRRRENDPGLVRTILAVNEAEQSLTFAGDIPEGSYAQLMKANFDRLITGAQGAAKISRGAPESAEPELALLISCVGRKLVLKQRVEDELETVRDTLGKGAALTGFYSYGEICPAAPNASCELHNQTMTITTFSER